MGMGERLLALRKARGLTQRELAERSGMADSAVRKYESGRQTPKLATAERLAWALGVSVSALLEEEPEEGLWLPPEERPPSRAILTDPGIPRSNLLPIPQGRPSSAALALSRDYDRLDEEGQRAVRDTADRELERMCQAVRIKVRPPKEELRRRVGPVERLEVYDQAAAAGLGNYLSDSPRHTEQYLPEELPRGTDFGVVIRGDSMEPQLHSGGTAFVRSTPEIEPGQIGIFVLNGEAYCKKLMVDRDSRRIRLVSLNPVYSDIELREADELRTLGQVLGQHTPGWPDEPFFF